MMKCTFLLFGLISRLIFIECGVTVGVVDHSPYCEPLAKITSLCDQLFIHIMCPKTCQMEHTIKKTCGISKYADTSDFGALKRKKRHDFVTKKDESILEEVKDVENKLHSRVRRVVGGNEAKKGAYPWNIAIYFKQKLRCSGALLTPDWVVTSASCFDDDKTSYEEAHWFIMAGEHSLSRRDGTELLRNVKKLIVHDRNYKYWKIGYHNVPDDYDVALLKLESPLVLGDHISPICLPGLNEVFSSKDSCRIMGWGAKKSDGLYQDVPREATVKIVPRDICNLPISYNGTIHERAICAGYETLKADACEYDSGASLACMRGKRWFSVGLVSYGYKCGKPNQYGVFTNLPLMKSWIIERILSYDDKTNSIISIFERVASLTPPGVISVVKINTKKGVTHD